MLPISVAFELTMLSLGENSRIIRLGGQQPVSESAWLYKSISLNQWEIFVRPLVCWWWVKTFEIGILYQLWSKLPGYWWVLRRRRVYFSRECLVYETNRGIHCPPPTIQEAHTSRLADCTFHPIAGELRGIVYITNGYESSLGSCMQNIRLDARKRN